MMGLSVSGGVGREGRGAQRATVAYTGWLGLHALALEVHGLGVDAGDFAGAQGRGGFGAHLLAGLAGRRARRRRCGPA